MRLARDIPRTTQIVLQACVYYNPIKLFLTFAVGTAILAILAWGLWLALRVDGSDAALARAHATLLATRPTAVNLRWALDRHQIIALQDQGPSMIRYSL